MTANSEEANPASSTDPQSEDNPSIYACQAKGPDLCIHMSEVDPLNHDIQKGYLNNKVFKKVLEKPKEHPDFSVQNKYIWRKNHNDEDVLYVPSWPPKVQPYTVI
jgi:hypothetical protein